MERYSQCKTKNVYIWWKAQSFSIWECQQLVVIQNRIQVLDPFRINISIKDDPLSFLQFSSHVVYNSG